MEQLAIDLQRRSRRNDQETSKAAAANVRQFEGSHFRAILVALIAGEGTIYELSQRTRPHLDQVQIARRCSELARAGKIVRTGKTKPGPNGTPCCVWRLA